MNDKPVPRRLSVHDADYDHSIGQALDIFVDGVLQTHVEGYDLDAGELVRHVLDDEGNVQLTKDRQGIQRETVRGNIEIRWKADA